MSVAVALVTPSIVAIARLSPLRPLRMRRPCFPEIFKQMNDIDSSVVQL